MPDIFYLFSKWWKHILSIVVISLVAIGIILYLRPSKYLSTTTALPASSYAADRASIFNQNIQSLYSALGTPDDLDVIVGTAQLDTPYIAISENLGLAAHYKVKEQGRAAVLKAAFLLKANTRVIKTEYSELKVKVWDKDKTMAPELANAIMNKLQSIHQDLQNSNNFSLIKTLQKGKEKLRAGIDSVTSYLSNAGRDEGNSVAYVTRRQQLLDQEQQYEKLISEYQLIADSKPPVLIILEKARVSDWPDKPRRIPIIVATFLLSLLFALVLALLLEKRKVVQQ